MKKAKDNHGLIEYQDQQKNYIIQQIDIAISNLRKKGLPITKTSIADEAEISRRVMYKEHVTAHLCQYPEFNGEASAGLMRDEKIQKYEAEIIALKSQLKQSRDSKKLLEAKHLKLQEETKALLEKYERLLGEYQIQVGNKITPF